MKISFNLDDRAYITVHAAAILIPRFPRRILYRVVKWNATVKQTVHSLNNTTILYDIGFLLWQHVSVFI
jgi:hypothetical protein